MFTSKKRKKEAKKKKTKKKKKPGLLDITCFERAGSFRRESCQNSEFSAVGTHSSESALRSWYTEDHPNRLVAKGSCAPHSRTAETNRQTETDRRLNTFEPYGCAGTISKRGALRPQKPRGLLRDGDVGGRGRGTL